MKTFAPVLNNLMWLTDKIYMVWYTLHYPLVYWFKPSMVINLTDVKQNDNEMKLFTLEISNALTIYLFFCELLSLKMKSHCYVTKLNILTSTKHTNDYAQNSGFVMIKKLSILHTSLRIPLLHRGNVTFIQMVVDNSWRIWRIGSHESTENSL